MSRYSDYFLNSASSVAQLETIEISHSKFTQVYRVVRNACDGITAKIEDETTHFFEYCPLAITPISTSDDLDQSLKVSFGDLGEILPKEFDAVEAGGGFQEKPVLTYRVYRSDDLETMLFGPLTFEVGKFSFTKEGATFEAKAPSINVNKTGEIYSLDRFPMLRGFL